MTVTTTSRKMSEPGIDWSSGEVLITMDGDLQNDPEDIPLLLAKLDEGYDAVLGLRAKRQEMASTYRPGSTVFNQLDAQIAALSSALSGPMARARRRSSIA